MQRKAILIASGGSQNATGSAALSAWSNFLQSDVGGAWKSDQIVEALAWRRDRLINLVKSTGSPEYALIVYLGKGRAVKADVPWTQLELELNADEKVLDGELDIGSPRCGMILDASGYSTEHRALTLTSAPRSDSAAILYEAEIERAERGSARIWVTRSSVAIEPTLSFSGDVISRAIDWANNNRGALSFSQAVELIAPAGQETNGRKVEYRGGRRNHDLPFAVGGLR